MKIANPPAHEDIIAFDAYYMCGDLNDGQDPATVTPVPNPALNMQFKSVCLSIIILGSPVLANTTWTKITYTNEYNVVKTFYLRITSKTGAKRTIFLPISGKNFYINPISGTPLTAQLYDARFAQNNITVLLMN